MGWRALSEEFHASVSATTRQGLFDRFTEVAVDYFGVTKDNLTIRCYAAGIDEEIKSAGGDLVRRTYTADFGAVIRQHTDD